MVELANLVIREFTYLITEVISVEVLPWLSDQEIVALILRLLTVLKLSRLKAVEKQNV